ncbi:tetratricopeptide repeat protein [Methylococcus sp. Mc7]|uniref:tetratricopeptide repeat protein n=1 Tax=Methylococcus sp. Mc7 TaxID=2860258 RepID=UPI001C53403A|nr:tetratricopeptide repeat protein [Methylococcus sp. Mc7]QXP85766.1 tetratricopeptide repeat protein [Methylococcus sp. Mc7]
MASISIVVRDKTPEETEISNLLKLATAQAGDKDYDSAISSLRRAYSLMETVSTEWPITTYFRLARYLHLSDRYPEAIEWLQDLHDNLDSRCDAREALYKEWGWMQGRNKPAKISKTVRNNLRRTIKQEIALYKERQQKIEQRAEKREKGKMRSSVASKTPPKTIDQTAPQERAAVLGADVGEAIFNFTQRCFIGERSKEPLDVSAEDFVFARLANGPLTVLDVHQLPSKHKRLVREILTQYVMFLELNRSLPFPPDFLDGTSHERLCPPLLQYICEHRWPFPQMLTSKQ